MTVDGAATVEALRAELARAKEQARLGNAAALKAAEELRAEKAAHGESRKNMANMAVELKAAVDRLLTLWPSWPSFLGSCNVRPSRLSNLRPPSKQPYY